MYRCLSPSAMTREFDPVKIRNRTNRCSDLRGTDKKIYYERNQDFIEDTIDVALIVIRFI